MLSGKSWFCKHIFDHPRERNFSLCLILANLCVLCTFNQNSSAKMRGDHRLLQGVTDSAWKFSAFCKQKTDQCPWHATNAELWIKRYIQGALLHRCSTKNFQPGKGTKPALAITARKNVHVFLFCLVCFFSFSTLPILHTRWVSQVALAKTCTRGVPKLTDHRRLLSP